MKTLAIQEAIDFVKTKSESLSKAFTQEFHHIITSFLEFKERFHDDMETLDHLNQSNLEMTMLNAIESSSKEAMYALDETNPLSFYNCLIPELAVYRPKRLQSFTKAKRTRNGEALLELAEKELLLVSASQMVMVSLTTTNNPYFYILLERQVSAEVKGRE